VYLYLDAGGGVVLLYASKYHDVKAVVNLSGRYDMKAGIEERLGYDYMKRIKEDGFIDVKSSGNLFFNQT
jgi:dienelactone hydrolase